MSNIVPPSNLTQGGQILPSDVLALYNFLNAGVFSIQNATASANPVAYGQVVNTPPIGASSQPVAGTTASLTTGTFTAPCSGIALVFGTWELNATLDGATTSLSSSLSGLTNVTGTQGTSAVGYLPMTEGQTSTFTVTGSNTTSANFIMTIFVFFIPLA